MIYYGRVSLLLAVVKYVLSETALPSSAESAAAVAAPAIMRRESPLSTGSAVQLGASIPIRIEDESMSQMEGGAVDSAEAVGAALREGLLATTPTTTEELVAGKELHGTSATPEPAAARTTVLPYSSVVGGEGTVGATTTAAPQLVRESTAPATTGSTTAPFALPYEKVYAPVTETNNASKEPAIDTGSGARDDLFTHSPERAENGFGDYVETNPITPPLGPQKETSLGPLGTRDMLRAMKVPTLGDSIAAGSDLGIATPPLLTKEAEKTLFTKEDENTLLGEVRTIPIPTEVISEAEPSRIEVPLAEKKLGNVEAREQMSPASKSALAPTTTEAAVLEPIPKAPALSAPMARSREVPPGNIEQFASLGFDATKGAAVQTSVTAPPTNAAAAPAPPPLAPSVVVNIMGYPAGSSSFNGIPMQPMQSAQQYSVAQQPLSQNTQQNSFSAPQVVSQMPPASVMTPAPVQMLSTNIGSQVAYAPLQETTPTQMYLPQEPAQTQMPQSQQMFSQQDPNMMMQVPQMPQFQQDPNMMMQLPQIPQEPATVMQMPQMMMMPQEPAAVMQMPQMQQMPSGADESSMPSSALLQQALMPGADPLSATASPHTSNAELFGTGEILTSKGDSHFSGLQRRTAAVHPHGSLESMWSRDEQVRPTPGCCPGA
eukprot:CAMPEP_0169119386 /NCGR_PEP_ID=MMETSP1015-20121227/31529_1 /TAXON_ID=342587 /ORGANISM="Karlodinium micrum, Strain CCMP2283" /LENGTH=659 /DNA_ID=CAMNT_0009182263 /DNA_START=35 /DNA_END=2014 /DNA_ORIENTATION=-